MRRRYTAGASTPGHLGRRATGSPHATLSSLQAVLTPGCPDSRLSSLQAVLTPGCPHSRQRRPITSGCECRHQHSSNPPNGVIERDRAFRASFRTAIFAPRNLLQRKSLRESPLFPFAQWSATLRFEHVCTSFVVPQRFSPLRRAVRRRRSHDGTSHCRPREVIHITHRENHSGVVEISYSLPDRATAATRGDDGGCLPWFARRPGTAAHLARRHRPPQRHRGHGHARSGPASTSSRPACPESRRPNWSRCRCCGRVRSRLLGRCRSPSRSACRPSSRCSPPRCRG